VANVTDAKEAVRSHWEEDPCAADLATSDFGSSAFYDEIADAKDQLEPERDGFARFADTRGQDVLEVGVGLGVDFVRFARAGARAVGIDLTQAAVDSTRRLVELEGLQATVMVGDAEQLPFLSDSFDVVYSWGVLHHTPNTQRSIDEVLRVLRPDGEARVMLYALHSPFAVGVWGRQVLRERRRMSVRAALARGLESPGTKAYTDDEIERMFSRFATVERSRLVTAYDRKVLGPLARIVGHGWQHLIRARKGDSQP
jgi:ubiquinone/menaquinone biosynthesis C-methylase UbiE